MQAEEVSDPQGTAPAPRSPAAEEPEQADAEPSTKAAAPAPPDEVAAEAASAEPVAAQPTPPEDSAAQPAPAKADATQPAPSQADVARPAHAATVAPEAAPAAAAATAEATRDLEMAPPAVPDSVADEKDDPAEPTAVSAPSSESQGELLRGMHCKPLQICCHDVFSSSGLPHSGRLSFRCQVLENHIHTAGEQTHLGVSEQATPKKAHHLRGVSTSRIRCQHECRS